MSIRWRVSRLLDKLPGQCWANLVSWALSDRRSPWSPIDDVCRSDLAATGTCYCGKLRAEPTAALLSNRSTEG